MLKCITFDGDASTLNTLMGYLEKLDKALADVHQVLSKEQTERPIFVREGSKIIRLRREEILFLEGYGDYVKVHRINGKPLLTQVSLKRFEEFLDRNRFLPGTSFLHRIPSPTLIISSASGYVSGRN